MDCPEIDSDEDGSHWVERARQGDRQAFDRLASQYRPVVQAVVFGRVGLQSEAEDLVQDVLMTAWRKLSSLREPAAFPGRIRAIAINACRGWRRRSSHWPESLDSDSNAEAVVDPTPGPLDALLIRERERALRKALDRIPAANRVALLLHVWGEYSYAEIARLTGARVTTIEGRIYRAKKQLRHLIDADPDQTIFERRQWRQEVEP